VEQSAQEGGWVDVDDVALPRGQSQRTFVLATRTVLRKHARPVVPIALHHHDTRSAHLVNAGVGMDRDDAGRDVGDNAGIALITGHAERVGAPLPGHATVTEVVAEQNGIGSRVGAGAATAHEAAVGSPARADPVVTPVPEGRPAHAELLACCVEGPSFVEEAHRLLAQ
jgi:hypothetical protein